MVTIILLAACALSLIFGHLLYYRGGKRGMAVCSRRARARVVGDL